MATRKRNTQSDPDAFFIGVQNALKYTAENAGINEAAKWDSETTEKLMPLYDSIMDRNVVQNIVLKQMAEREVLRSVPGTNVSLSLWDMSTNMHKKKQEILKTRRNELNAEITLWMMDARKYIMRSGARQTMPSFFRTTGGLSLIASASGKKDVPVMFNSANPDVSTLLDWSNENWANPFVRGNPGSGKTNVAVMLTAMSIMRHGGEMLDRHRLFKFPISADKDNDWLRKKGITRGTLRVYFPSVEFPMENGKPYPYAYRFMHPYEIFIDDPPGSSVLWTKHDQVMNRENNMGFRPESIYSIVFLGEMGRGTLSHGTSNANLSFFQAFQYTRQMGLRFIMSGTDDPGGSIVDKMNPIIDMARVATNRIDYAGRPIYRYEAVAQYLSDDSKKVIKKPLGEVRLHPLTLELNEAISGDLTADLEAFPLKELMVESGITQVHKLDQWPSKIQEFSDAVKEMYDISSRNEYPDGEKVKGGPAPVQKRRTPSNDDDLGLMP
jgi:hypothetical protein